MSSTQNYTDSRTCPDCLEHHIPVSCTKHNQCVSFLEPGMDARRIFVGEQALKIRTNNDPNNIKESPNEEKAPNKKKKSSKRPPNG